MLNAKPLRLFRVAVSPLSVLVLSGGATSEVVTRNTVQWHTQPPCTLQKSHEKFLTIDSLVFLSALAAHALSGAPNARN
jgi:hypothetical protein